MTAYQDLFSWRYPVTDQVVGHHDGVISVAVLYDGFHLEVKTPEQRRAILAAAHNALGNLPDDIVHERHLWRQPESVPAKAYYERHQSAVRCQEVAERVRRDMANHHASLGMTNRVAMVFSRSVSTKGVGQFRKQEKAAEQLIKALRSLLSVLPGARLASVQEYGHLVQYTNDWALHEEPLLRQTDFRFHLNETWTAPRPVYDADHGFTRMGERWLWTGLMDLYPDEVYWGWADFFADAQGVRLHLAQITQTGNKRKAINDAEKAEKSDREMLGRRGSTLLSGKVTDVAGYRQYLAAGNQDVINNTYIVSVVSDDAEALYHLVDRVKNHIQNQGARIQDSEAIQMACYRWSHPGQGYTRRFSRPDASDLVSAMCPWLTHDPGTGGADHMRLSAQGKLVTYHYPEGAANHGFVAGKTRSGKGVEAVARLLESYPLGLNHYIIEAGGSFRWPIKALGGNYIVLDPDKHVINPFPDYQLVQDMARAKGLGANDIPPSLVGPTIAGLALILTGGYIDFDDDGLPDGHHYKSRAETAMRALYNSPDDAQNAPTFIDYLAVVHLLLDESDDPLDQASYRFLRDNIESFLTTSAGERFAEGEDTLDLTGDLIGVDIKPLVDSKDSQLLSIYLTTIFLRLGQKVIANRDPAQLSIDEYHLPAQLAPELTASLTSIAVRMWAKENGRFEALSQGAEDVAVDPIVLEQISHRQFMYMEGGHEHVRTKFNLPDLLFERFTQFPEPSLAALPYRQAIRTLGDHAWEFNITLPEWMLLLGETSPEALTLKEQLEQEFPGPFNLWFMLDRFKERWRS